MSRGWYAKSFLWGVAPEQYLDIAATSYDPDILHGLTETQGVSVGILLHVARNPRTQARTLEALYYRSCLEDFLRHAILQNPNCPTWLKTADSLGNNSL